MDTFKPLDLVLFNGIQLAKFINRVQSSAIQKHRKEIEKRIQSNPENLDQDMPIFWSHVGLIVTRDLLHDPRLHPDRLYVLESTMSGDKNDGVMNIDDSWFFGVQIRPFEDLLRTYARAIHPDTGDVQGDSRMGIAILRGSPFRRSDALGKRAQEDLQLLFTSWYKKKWENTRYDWNFISLAAARWPRLRPLRKFAEKTFHTDDWLFCSELVFLVMQTLGFYPDTIDARNTLPMDLLGYDLDSPAIPAIFEIPRELLQQESSVTNSSSSSPSSPAISPVPSSDQMVPKLEGRTSYVVK